MPTFETPQPVHVTLEVGVADIRIEAGDRTDTVVEVRPSDPDKKADVAAAEHTLVEFASGRLQIKAPKGWRQYTPRGGAESIDVQIQVPAGSHIRGEGAVADLRADGRLGECRFTTGVGAIRLDQAGPVQLKTGAGDISAERVLGPAEITTASGAVQVGGVDGYAVVKNSNGDTQLGEVTGDLRVSAANGAITIERARATVSVKTANGAIRLGRIERGAVVAQTGCGPVDVGIRDGVAAWLDLTTRFGTVHNGLDAVERPAPGEDSVELRVRSGFGDIAVRRCASDAHDAEAREDAV